MAERKKEKFSRDVYEKSYRAHVPKSGPATFRAEQIAYETNKLDHSVDPASDGLIRRSLPRFVDQKNGLYRLDVGVPMPLIVRSDTTGSMGYNVDVILRVLADLYELCSRNLPEYDLQVLTEIFGDIQDRLFVLCRSQFEFTAPKILEYLMKMVPGRAGGDIPEDGHYGLLAEAFLSDVAIGNFGLKGYDITITDAPGRMLYDKNQIIRIFGNDVFNVMVKNGHVIDPYKLPTLIEVMQEIRKHFHAFVLQVREDNVYRRDTTEFWSETHGADCVIKLPDTEYTPQAVSAIIGLTEGRLNLQNVEEFLIAAGVREAAAEELTRSLAKIPIGAQTLLPGYNNLPAKGSLFRSKTDTQPMSNDEINEYLLKLKKEEEDGPKIPDNWL